MKRNNIILTIITFLLCLHVMVYLFEFEIRTRTEYWITLIETTIVSLALILIFFLKTEWWKKLLAIFGLPALLIFGLPYTGLWKFSLKKYVKNEKINYLVLAGKIDQLNKSELTYISCFEDGRLNTRPKLDKETMTNGWKSICSEFQNTDCVAIAIQKDKNYYLFIMSSFIGNGYGLLYCNDNPHSDEIINIQINGYEITNVIKVENNWFYVSFT
ncbi:MAG: hypothetical protein HUU01_03215 [Saprospiraceae bacterium]|nr:hypothetical protein [Saprospiraceae bacterium]